MDIGMTRDIHRAAVPLQVCGNCHRPIYWSGIVHAWVHDEPGRWLLCREGAQPMFEAAAFT